MADQGEHPPGMTERNFKTALITGAREGHGHAIARDLARAGWLVALQCDQTPRETIRPKEASFAGGGRVVLVAADMSDETQVQGLVGKVTAVVGPLKCLINTGSVFFGRESSGAGSPSPVDGDMVDHRSMLSVLIQAFASGIAGRVAGEQGNIINVTDLPYQSMTGLWSLIRSFALTLAPGIRINAIGPGPVLPGERRIDGACIEQWPSLPFAPKMATEEIVAAIGFILDTPSLTGQVIALGGREYPGVGPVGDDQGECQK